MGLPWVGRLGSCDGAGEWWPAWLAQTMGRELLGGGQKRQAHARWSSQELHLSCEPVVWTREDALPHENKVSSSFFQWHKQPAGCTRTSCHHFSPRGGELCFLLRVTSVGCISPGGHSCGAQRLRKLFLSSYLLSEAFLTWGVWGKGPLSLRLKV